MIDVTVVLLEGSLPSTSMAPLEIFSSAGTLWGTLMGEPSQNLFRVRTASLTGKHAQAIVPVALAPSVALRDVQHTDLVIVPSAGMDVLDVRRRYAGEIEWLVEQDKRRTTLAGICTGVALLAWGGLLDGRPATTHWGLVDQCRAAFPRVLWDPQRFVTESDHILCGGGVYASIDLSLHLVERYCGHEVTVKTARSLLLETPRIWQTTHAAHPPRSAHDDEPVQRAQQWLVAHFPKEVDLDELAATVGMSPRNFARRFKAATGEAPLAYLHRLRIDAARHALENKHRTVEEISAEVGYGDVAFFRKLFKRHTGSSPRDYRARFGPRADA
jgi:transcriptional regulator GlxA family with amidase domain